MKLLYEVKIIRPILPEGSVSISLHPVEKSDENVEHFNGQPAGELILEPILGEIESIKNEQAKTVLIRCGEFEILRAEGKPDSGKRFFVEITEA